MDNAGVKRDALFMVLSAAGRLKSGQQDGAPLGIVIAKTDEDAAFADLKIEALRACLHMAQSLRWIDRVAEVYTRRYPNPDGSRDITFGIRQDASNPNQPARALHDGVRVLKEAMHSVIMWHPTPTKRAEAEKDAGYLNTSMLKRPHDEAEVVYETKVWLRIFQQRGLLDARYAITEETREDGSAAFCLSVDGVRMTPERFHAGRGEGR